MTLGGVNVEGGFPELSDATSALIADARGRRLLVADFYKLANAIEALYHDAGFPLVRLAVPPQHINNGDTLRLVVIDGFIEQIDDHGLADPARHAVEADLDPLIGRRHVTEGMIERALTLAGQGPGVTLRSALGAGKEEGGVVLVVEGEQSLVTGSFEVDNRLAASLGVWETTLQFAVNQPLQLGEQLYGYISGGADEHPFSTYSPRRVAGVGFQLPLGHDGLVLNPEYTWSLTKPIAVSGTLPTVSRFERATLRLIYPWLLDHGRSLTLTGTIDATTETDIIPFFAAELDKDQLRVGRIDAEWDSGLSWGARLHAGAILSQGVAAFGARTDAQANSSGIGLSRFDEDPSFTKLELSLSYQQPLPFGFAANFTAHGQSALRGVLPTSELFSLDGEDRLSMFTTGALSSDSGWTLRQELSRPFDVAAGPVDLTAAPYIFGAAGDGISAIPGVSGVGYNSSYGAGLRLSWKVVSTSMELGRRIANFAGLSGTQFFFKGQVQF